MKVLHASIAALLLATPAAARATGFTDIGEDIKAQTDTTVKVTGTFRIRGAAFYNLDLDRGPTPSGQFLFPLPLSNPTSHLIEAADLRLPEGMLRWRGDVHPSGVRG